MARAMEWGGSRDAGCGGDFLAVNVGSDEWNYQVKDLAEAVAKIIPGVDISINKDALPDKRSYRVNFDLFKQLAPNHQPVIDLETSIFDLKKGMEAIGMRDENFRNSDFMRLKHLTRLQEKGLLSKELKWVFQ
jgi:nucleoside-diphosphate-sugar epimerase